MLRLPPTLSWFARHRLGLVAGFTHQIDPGRCRFHRHDHIELVWHRRGRGTSRVASGAELAFAPGQATLYPPRTLHDQANSEAGEDVCLHLDSGSSPPAVLNEAHVVTVAPQVAQEIAALAAAPPQRSAAEQVALDLRSTAVVLALLAGADGAAAPAHGSGHAGLAARYLAEHFATVGRMEEVARYVGLSEDRLRHVFIAEHGVGLLEYLTQIRLDQACTLLRRTDLPLAAIAQSCGFATARYLCSLFSARFGCPPGEWRRRAPVRTAPRGR